jgi:hypothetical protein
MQQRAVRVLDGFDGSPRNENQGEIQVELNKQALPRPRWQTPPSAQVPFECQPLDPQQSSKKFSTTTPLAFDVYHHSPRTTYRGAVMPAAARPLVLLHLKQLSRRRHHPGGFLVRVHRFRNKSNQSADSGINVCRVHERAYPSCLRHHYPHARVRIHQFLDRVTRPKPK